MTVQSFTGRIKQLTYEDIDTLTSLTLTIGNTYTIQIQNQAWFKVGDAEFTINSDTPFQYKHGSNDPQLKTTELGVMLTILENEE